MTRTLMLNAPLAGWSMPLDEVPDAVFAQRMAGDGVAIDPTGAVLHAPCAGRIFPMPGSQHALTLRTDIGADILLHVGIETVALAGAGFESLIKVGQSVQSGQPLLRFDLDLIARRARSAVTPILLVSGGRVQRCNARRSVAVGDFLMEIELDAEPEEAVTADSHGQIRRTFRVGFDHGIHARPAALIVAALKPFTVQVRMLANGRQANARSAVALMALGVQRDERIEVHAEGDDAEAAMDALSKLLGKAADTAADARAVMTELIERLPLPESLPAVTAHRGLAIGKAVQVQQPTPSIVEHADDAGEESSKLSTALGVVRVHLESLAAEKTGEQRAILSAHAELIQDPELRERAEHWIVQGRSAAFGWHKAIAVSMTTLSSIADPHIRERLADLRDLELQVQRVLAGEPPTALAFLPENAILLADELLPSQLLALDRRRIAGLCCARGGPTSHIAIIAAAMGIPALVAAGEQVLQIADGAELLLDAEEGQLRIAPKPEECARIRRLIAARQERNAEDLKSAGEPAKTLDGATISVMANLGGVAETGGAVSFGAEGVGLLRSEFLFLQRQQPPNEDEQRREYQSILDAMHGRTLTIRTLDIGGDKPIPYLPLPREENPALGLRGLRTSLAWPDLLRTQLRAILCLRPLSHCRVLLPMVTDVEELRTVRSLMESCGRELGVDALPKLGVMIETPASALLADQLLLHADFLSIGSNDLSQYVLAMDRGHASLAAKLDALHPAVLRLIASVAAVGHELSREVAVCGGLASDTEATPLLIGLGIRELSAVPSAIPELKRVVRSLNVSACRALALSALELTHAGAVREHLAVWRAAHR